MWLKKNQKHNERGTESMPIVFGYST